LTAKVGQIIKLNGPRRLHGHGIPIVFPAVFPLQELFLLVIQDKKIQRLMDELDLPPDRANLPRDGTNDGTLWEEWNG